MELLDSGKSQNQVAHELGVTQSAVSKWAIARRQGGQDGLKAKPHPGRPKKLTESQVKKLVNMLLESPRKHGFPTDLWTLARIAELFERKFDVSYDPSGVARDGTVELVGSEARTADAVSAVTVSPQRRRLGLVFNLLDHNIATDDFELFVERLLRKIRGPITIGHRPARSPQECGHATAD